MNRGVVGHTLNAMESIQILVHGDLEHGSSSLSVKQHFTLRSKSAIPKHIPASDGAVGQEEDPDTVPAVAVRSNHLVLVADPVLVPSVEGCRIMDTENVNILDLKTSTFKLKLK